MKKIGILLSIFLCMFFLKTYSQDLIKPAKLNVKWGLNTLGDAHIETSMSMDAAQWDNYKKTIGSNPDILKRQMERTFPGYFLQNFNYKEDVMNRGWTLSFDALGLSRINSKGLWQVDLNSKNPDVTKLSDKNYVLTSNYATGGSLMQEIDNITFPDGASDVKQDKDAFGKAMFIYSSSPGGGSGGWLTLGLGALLLIIGAIMFVRVKPAMAAVKK
ncbi:MAG TPA: hypothetical protein VKT28_02710 [Puia sp.]|nr:hypothetical protein [Puia sp.]